VVSERLTERLRGGRAGEDEPSPRRLQEQGRICWWRDSEPGVRGESLGVRSTVVGFHVVGVQTVEEFPDRPLGSEHVKGHMLTVLRNDFVFALRL
jgi:hypothetical protein